MENKTVNQEPVSQDTEQKEPLADAVGTEDAPKEGDTIAALQEKIAKLEEAIKEKDDLYLRMAAEYDNFRRRSREEREAAYDNAVADTVSELLPIIDNLERATKFDDGEKVKEGLNMTLKTVAPALKALHVESFGEAGDRFDPMLHNAVLHEEDGEKGEAQIAEVFQKGYKKGSKIIRFALVKTVN